MANTATVGGTPTRLLVNPTRDDLEHEQKRRQLHPLIIEDLQGPRRRPKFTRFGHLVWLSLWDVMTSGDVEGHESDIALIFDTDELLIVQRGPVAGLRDLAAALEQPTSQARTAIGDVCLTLQPPVADFVGASATIEASLGSIEAALDTADAGDGFTRLYALKRQVVRVCRAASGIAEVLRDASSDLDIATSGEPRLRPYFQHLHDDAHGVAELAATQITTIDALAGLMTAQTR